VGLLAWWSEDGQEIELKEGSLDLCKDFTLILAGYGGQICIWSLWRVLSDFFKGEGGCFFWKKNVVYRD
jgi:hypothetical protein